EGRARARALALGTDGPAVELDEVPDDGEPEPEAAVLSGRRAVDLPEALEDEREMLRVDADTGVDDRDRDHAREAAGGEAHGAARGGVTDRVAEQVPHDLLDAIG